MKLVIKIKTIICKFLFVATYSFALSIHIYSFTNQIKSTLSSEINWDEFNSLMITLDDFNHEDQITSNYLQSLSTDEISRSLGVDPNTVIIFLTAINPIEILKQDFYLLTNPFNKRSLLDGAFPEWRSQLDCDNSFAFHAFARKTNALNFTSTETTLDSYLALSDDTLIERLQESTDRAAGFADEDQFNLDIDKIFKLFVHMTVVQREGGFLFDYYHAWEKWRMRALLPAYYIERNFYLTDAQLKAYEREFGVTSEAEQEKFRKTHIISDKLGFGDTRFELDREIFNGQSFQVRAGLLSTIPTAFAIKKGLKGSSFPKLSTFPSFDIDELFCLLIDPSPESQMEAVNLLDQLALDAFDRLAANLLETKLGNDGHFGFGLFLRSKARLSWLIATDWADKIAMNNRISLEYLIPATEKRFFINRINQKELDAINLEEIANARDTNLSIETISFLERKAVERLFLRAFPVTIKPGIIFHWYSNALYEGKKFNFGFGTDFWFQDKEKFGTIHIDDEIKQQLNIQKAKPPVAWQSKLHTRIEKKLYTNTSDCKFWIGVDWTIARKGIGADFGVTLGFESTF